MKKALSPIRLATFLVMLCIASPAVHAEVVLTNESVVEMVEMGILDVLIISKIRASKCDFDTSSGALLELMKKGIKSDIVKAMIEEDAHPSKLCEQPEEAPEAAPAQTAGEESEYMVRIKGGCFQMGDSFGFGRNDEIPVHEVCLDDFYLARFEVTVGEYRKFMNEEGYRSEITKGGNCWFHSGKKWRKVKDNNWHKVGYKQTEKDPITCVNWNDAMAYIKWRSIKDGRMYRLPTEAEWEYAATGGGKHYLYSWGNELPSGNIADKSLRIDFPNWLVWEGYDDGHTYTSPVGSFKPNDLGLYDMTGNVWEWVSDWYAADSYDGAEKENPMGTQTGVARILRGGSWFDAPSDIRNTYRSWNYPSLRNFYNGFRLAASVE
jgi:formylglycine-generating enzyme required for sulfatase activity